IAVDFTNLWFHRQIAQNAADAACGAAAMDMLKLANLPGSSPPVVTAAHLNPPNAFTCSSTDITDRVNSKVACWYAAVNGYTSPGLTANTEGNSVVGVYPDLSACPNGAGCPVPGYSPPTAALPGAWANNSVIEISVVERVKVAFLGFFGGGKTRDV